MDDKKHLKNTSSLQSHLTLEEIAQMFDVTRERIRQIEAKALRKVGAKLRSISLTSTHFFKD